MAFYSRLVLGLIFALNVHAVHVTDRKVQATDIVNAQGVSVFKFPTTAPTASNACVYNADGEITSAAAIPVSLGGFGHSMAAVTITSAGTQTALAPGLIRYATASGATVQGFAAPSPEASNFSIIYNTDGAASISIVNEGGSAPAANRILTRSGATTGIGPRSYGFFVRDTVAQRWRLIDVGSVVSATSPLSISTLGALSMPAATSGNNGYLTASNWSTFNNKLSGVGTAGVVPVYTGSQTLAANGPLTQNATLQNVGIQVGVGNETAVLDVESDFAQTLGGVSGASFSPTQFTAPTSPAFTITQTTPDIQSPGVSAFATNLGSGGYSGGDIVDYIVTASDGSVWGVSSTQQTGIQDASSFDIDVTLTQDTQNSTNTEYSIARNINGAGYNDYQRVSGSFTDNNSGWSGGADTLTPLADDFLANGTAWPVIAHGTVTSPIATTIVDSGGYNPSFTDDASQRAFKMQVDFTGGGDFPARFEWPSTQQYEAADATQFILGPAATPGAPTLTPTTYGIESNGGNSFSAEVYNYQASPVLYPAVGVDAGTWSDPNDGNFYYFPFTWSGGTGSAKVVLSNGAAKLVIGGSTTTYDGVTPFGDSTTVTPTSAYAPVGRFASHGSAAADPATIISQSLDGSYSRFEFQNSSGTALAYLSTSATQAFFGKSGGAAIELTATGANITGTATVSGSVTTGALTATSATIGSSASTITKVVSATATLNFASIAAGAIGTLTMTLSGGVAGDTVMLGPPSAIEAGLMWSGFFSGSNTVTIRLHNTTGSAIDPASATWRATLIKF